MQLTPMFENVDVRTHKGRYAVQLEIPEGSTLKPYEIDRVLALSSWDVDPNKGTDGYEGGRSLILRRNAPIIKNGMTLGGLQLSGTGYKELEFRGDLGFQADSPFQPPNSGNFMDHVTGTKMSTNYAKGTRILAKRPRYRARGTYTNPELHEKVRNTMDVSTLPLTKMVVPHVEAYGRYLEDELQDVEGPFGFCVFPAPAPEKERIMTATTRFIFNTVTRDTGIPEFIMLYFFTMSSQIGMLSEGMRELHDSGFVHLQAHLSNAYIIHGMPYLVDWGTAQRLGTDREENVLNRALDIMMPVDSYEKGFVSLVSQLEINREFTREMGNQVRSLIMQMYSDNHGREIDMVSVVRRAKTVLGGNPEGVEVVTQWMKDIGLEGFFPLYASNKGIQPSPELVKESIDRIGTTMKHARDMGSKAGRNDPCPCGSGMKFKKCCLH